MAFLIRVLLLAMLAACAGLPPGEDDTGRALKQSAQRVIDALVRFKHDRHAYPSSLYELVPDYLPNVPLDVSIHFERDPGVLQFTYSPDWPPNKRYECSAPVDTGAWVCVDGGVTPGNPAR